MNIVLLRVSAEALGERPLIDTPDLLARWIERQLNEIGPDDVEYDVSVVHADDDILATDYEIEQRDR